MVHVHSLKPTCVSASSCTENMNTIVAHRWSMIQHYERKNIIKNYVIDDNAVTINLFCCQMDGWQPFLRHFIALTMN